MALNWCGFSKWPGMCEVFHLLSVTHFSVFHPFQSVSNPVLVRRSKLNLGVTAFGLEKQAVLLIENALLACNFANPAENNERILFCIRVKKVIISVESLLSGLFDVQPK